MKPWTTSEMARLQSLIEGGNTIKESAYELRRSYDSVANKYREMHLPSRAEKFSDEVEKIRDLAEKGFIISEIGSEIGRSKYCVWARCKRLSIPLRKGTPGPKKGRNRYA